MPTIIKTADGKEHTFKCPECGHDKMEVVNVDVVEYAPVDRVTMDPWGTECSMSEYENGNFHAFQCKSCGHEVSDQEDLTAWVEEHIK